MTVTVDELVALLAAAQAWEHAYRMTETVPTTADLPRILGEINRAGTKLTAMLDAGKENR